MTSLLSVAELCAALATLSLPLLLTGSLGRILASRLIRCPVRASGLAAVLVLSLLCAVPVEFEAVTREQETAGIELLLKD